MHLGQVEVGGPDDLDALDVDQLVVEDVLGQQHLAGAAHDVAQVEPGRAQQHLGVADAIDGRGRDEGQAPPDPDDQPAHGRIDLAVGPAGHDVVEPPDLLTGLIAHRAAENAGQRDDGVEDALGREDAAGPSAALVRRALRGLTATARDRARPGTASWSAVAWPWSYLLWRARRVAVGRIGSAARGARTPGVSDRHLPRAIPRSAAHGDARGASSAGMARSEDAPAVLLGGSPLRMATPPSPSAPTGGLHPIRARPFYRRPAERAVGPSDARADGAGAGTVPRMDLAYPPEAEEFRPRSPAG